MNRSTTLYAASLVGLALLAFGPASQAATLSSVAPSLVATGAFDAVGALASRALDPSLKSIGVAGGGITDATATLPSAVPEPESMALFGLGIAAMLVAKRRGATKSR